MARTKRIPVQRSDGVVQMQKVSTKNLHLYGKVVINARGKVAYTKKSSEVRALEAVRGAEGKLRRVRLTLKASYNPADKDRKRSHKLKLEAEVVAVVSEDDLDDFKAELQAYAAEQAQRFGIDGIEVNEASNEPAADAVTGVNYASVKFRNKENETASQAIEDHAQALLEGYGVEAEPDVDDDLDDEDRDDLRAILERAEQRTDKRGRTYWMDPETGRRTLNPELVR